MYEYNSASGATPVQLCAKSQRDHSLTEITEELILQVIFASDYSSNVSAFNIISLRFLVSVILGILTVSKLVLWVVIRHLVPGHDRPHYDIVKPTLHIVVC